MDGVVEVESFVIRYKRLASGLLDDELQSPPLRPGTSPTALNPTVHDVLAGAVGDPGAGDPAAERAAGVPGASSRVPHGPARGDGWHVISVPARDAWVDASTLEAFLTHHPRARSRTAGDSMSVTLATGRVFAQPARMRAHSVGDSDTLAGQPMGARAHALVSAALETDPGARVASVRVGPLRPGALYAVEVIAINPHGRGGGARLPVPLRTQPLQHVSVDATGQARPLPSAPPRHGDRSHHLIGAGVIDWVIAHVSGGEGAPGSDQDLRQRKQRREAEEHAQYHQHPRGGGGPPHLSPTVTVLDSLRGTGRGHVARAIEAGNVPGTRAEGLARPGAEELATVIGQRIADGTLVTAGEAAVVLGDAAALRADHAMRGSHAEESAVGDHATALHGVSAVNDLVHAAAWTLALRGPCTGPLVTLSDSASVARVHTTAEAAAAAATAAFDHAHEAGACDATDPAHFLWHAMHGAGSDSDVHARHDAAAHGHSHDHDRRGKGSSKQRIDALHAASAEQGVPLPLWTAHASPRSHNVTAGACQLGQWGTAVGVRWSLPRSLLCGAEAVWMVPSRGEKPPTNCGVLRDRIALVWRGEVRDHMDVGGVQRALKRDWNQALTSPITSLGRCVGYSRCRLRSRPNGQWRAERWGW